MAFRLVLKDERSMKITIECSENQAGIILQALEEFFRLRMAQADHVAQSLLDDVADINDDISAYCDKRVMLEAALQTVVNIAYPTKNHSSDTCRNAADLWNCIRNAIYMAKPHDPDSWDVRNREPIQLGAELLPKVEVEL